MTEIQYIPTNQIVFNPFEQMVINREKVNEIKASILQHRDNGTKGLLQVPTARLVGDDAYELAFGKHRALAFRELAEQDVFFSEMPVIVRELSDEEMFELMAIENFHRRDISPIEEAKTLHVYMTQFNKTSVDAAKKFEKTDEYVRAAVRLLNLPEPVQLMVSEGRMTKTDARDMLVLDKVGGADLVAKAIEALGDEDFDSPKEAISYALRQGSEYLDKNAGWFSAGKNFPHKHLPALTVKDLESMIHYAEGYGDGVPILVIKDLLTLISSGMEVTDEAFPQINPSDLERLRILVNPTPCEKCPLHAVLDGSHYCGLKACQERKQEAWKKKQLDDIASKVGVPLYRKEDGGFQALSQYDNADKKLWKDGSPDLRLKEAKYQYNNFDGLNTTDLTVVVVGDTYEKRRAAAEKKNAKAEASNQSESEKRDIEAKKLELKAQAIMNFSWVVASHVFASSLDGIGSVELMKFQLTEINEYPDFPEGMDEDAVLENLDKMKVSDALKHMRRVLAYAMLEMYIIRKSLQVDTDKKKPVIEHAKNLEWIAALWEVKLPKDFMSQAEAYQAELDQQLKEIEPKKAKK